jgi:hypothetical protein
VAILSAAICVTMFALGFGVSIPISDALSSFADLVGVASAMVVLGLLSASGAAPDFVIALHERKPSLAISRGGEEVSETTRTASYSIRDSEPFVKTGDPTEGLTNLRHLLACRKGLSAEGGGLFCATRPPNGRRLAGHLECGGVGVPSFTDTVAASDGALRCRDRDSPDHASA